MKAALASLIISCCLSISCSSPNRLDSINGPLTPVPDSVRWQSANGQFVGYTWQSGAFNLFTSVDDITQCTGEAYGITISTAWYAPLPIAWESGDTLRGYLVDEFHWAYPNYVNWTVMMNETSLWAVVNGDTMRGGGYLTLISPCGQNRVIPYSFDMEKQ